jgi:hypothetical protein
MDFTLHAESTIMVCHMPPTKSSSSWKELLATPGPDGHIVQLYQDYVIPAEDYGCHRETVNQAIAEVIGEIKGPLLRSLVSWNQATVSGMPPSQALLLWVKDAIPEKFDEVLAFARKHEGEITGGSS